MCGRWSYKEAQVKASRKLLWVTHSIFIERTADLHSSGSIGFTHGIPSTGIENGTSETRWCRPLRGHNKACSMAWTSFPLEKPIIHVISAEGVSARQWSRYCRNAKAEASLWAPSNKRGTSPSFIHSQRPSQRYWAAACAISDGSAWKSRLRISSRIPFHWSDEISWAILQRVCNAVDAPDIRANVASNEKRIWRWDALDEGLYVIFVASHA